MSIARKTSSSKYLFIWLILAIFSLLWQCCCAKMLAPTRNSNHFNPNERCLGINEENIWHFCEHGGYIAENPNPKKCNDRYVCYVGLNKPCSRHDKCADNAICTMCGICQKCDSAENCSEFELCPNPYMWLSNMKYIKRFFQNSSANMGSERKF